MNRPSAWQNLQRRLLVPSLVSLFECSLCCEKTSWDLPSEVFLFLCMKFFLNFLIFSLMSLLSTFSVDPCQPISLQPDSFHHNMHWFGISECRHPSSEQWGAGQPICSSVVFTMKSSPVAFIRSNGSVFKTCTHSPDCLRWSAKDPAHPQTGQSGPSG